MKTGKHYFGFLTEDEQRNYKKACEEQKLDFYKLMESEFQSFDYFIDSIIWIKTEQGVDYWEYISFSERKEKPIEFKAHNPKKTIATFHLVFIYSVIVSAFLGLFLVIHTASYQQGYKSGYRNGIEKVDSIVNYEELTPESVEAVQKLQLNTMRYESK